MDQFKRCIDYTINLTIIVLIKSDRLFTFKRVVKTLNNQEEEFQCSECGADVPSEANTCPNCGANLEETAEEAFSPEEEFVDFPITSRPVDLTAILALLNENKIEYFINDNAMENIWGPNFIQLPRIMVHKDQVNIVKELIESIEKEEVQVLDNEVFKDSALEQPDKEQKLKGVEGVLFGLCLIMILGPIATIPYFIYDFFLYQDIFNLFPSIYTFVLFDLLVSIYLAYLSINAGIKLYKIQPNAVQKAKQFFIILIIYQVIAFLSVNIIFSVNNIPFNSETINIYDGLITETISSVTYALVSIIYLNNSERVKNTYSTSLELNSD